MKTLYDVLNVAPNCGAGIVAEAFRKAVKINHPDVNADDPEAAARFRQIVRAKTILGDPELRAVYDRMLDFERQQLHPTSKMATTLDARHIVVLAIVLAGVFTLFSYISEAPVAKGKVTEDAAHEAVNVVAVQPPPPTDTGARDKSDSAEASVPSTAAPPTRNAVAIEDVAPALNVAPAPTAEQESAGVIDVPPPSPTDVSARDTSEGAEGSLPSPVASSSTVPFEDAGRARSIAPTATTKVTAAIHSDGLTSSLSVNDARFYREQGVAAYRNDDVALAIADFNLAIRLDPNFKDAYIDRGIAFYRIREFNRAFADVAHAMHIENSRRIATPPLPKASPFSK
jgi:tetratricopeptide (TPR) repeat protein